MAALAHATTYGTWRSRPAGHIPHYTDTTPADARTLTRQYLTRHPKGGWLPPTHTTALLTHYGIHQIGLTPVTSADDAIRAAAALGGPIVLKADVAGVPHKSDAGAVQLDLRTETDIRRAYRLLTGKFGPRLRQILMQPMITGGTEVIIGVVAGTDVRPAGRLRARRGGHRGAGRPRRPARPADRHGRRRAHPVHPVSDRSLLGHRRQPATDQPALQDLLLRVSRLADDLPEVAELDLSPVIACPGGVSVVDARILITPAQRHDPFLRQLG